VLAGVMARPPALRIHAVTCSYVMRTQVMRALALLVIAACGTDDGDGEDVDCTKVAGTDVFVVGLEKAGSMGLLDFKMMSAEPAPPQRGDNTWVFQVNAMNAGVVGDPLDGMTLTVTPFMPSHQHGTPIKVNIAAAGQPGQYTLSPVNLWMPGVWETTIRAQQDTTVDNVVYKFCIN
jgi:hypothetical protein